MHLFKKILDEKANRVGPDHKQSVLFAYFSVSDKLVYEILGYLPYW